MDQNSMIFVKKYKNAQIALYTQHCSSFSELLDEAETCTLELRRIHFICTEIYKTFNIGPE